MDVTFYEIFKEEESAIKKYLPKTIKAKFFKEAIQETKDDKPLSTVISVRTQSDIPNDWKDQLKAVLSRSQGYDHLLTFKAQTQFKGDLGYLGNYCARSVAEHAVMAMMVLLKNLKKQVKQFENFNRDNLTGASCVGKKVCVIGVGNIGREIVDLLKGFEVNIKGVDIDPRFNDVDYIELKEGTAWADVIFCALPLTEQTRGLLDHAQLKNAKKCIFINISRAEISPIKDLKALLDENVLTSIALDIYEDEKVLATALRAQKQPSSETHKILMELKSQDNVLFTPHNAFNTEEALEEKAKLSAQAVKTYLKEGCFPHPVPST